MATSRNSPKSRSTKAKACRKRRRWPRSVALLLFLAIASGYWWAISSGTARVCQQASELLATDPDRAAAMLEQAVSDAGGDAPDAQLLWTRALLAAGRPREALGCFSLISNPAGADQKMLLKLADEAMSSGDVVLARFSLEAISKDSNNRPAVLHRLINLSEQSGNVGPVMAMAQELLALQPDHAASWLAVAQAQEQRLELHSASRSYEEVLKREQDTGRRASVLRTLVKLQVLVGERETARMNFEKLRTTTVLEPTDRINEVLLLRLEGEIEQARTKIADVVAESPDNMLARETRGTLAFNHGDNDTARTDFEAVVRAQPRNKQAHYKLAQTLLRSGQENEAQKHFKENRRLTEISARILKLEGNAEVGTAEINRLTELAACYDQLGQLETATRLRESARRLFPVDH
jgi:tetratricopeptide (TPR) repeat protein